MLQTIYDEIEAVFPSGYVMMGGDEVNLGAIANLPEIKAAAKKVGRPSWLQSVAHAVARAAAAAAAAAAVCR